MPGSDQALKAYRKLTCRARRVAIWLQYSQNTMSLLPQLLPFRCCLLLASEVRRLIMQDGRLSPGNGKPNGRAATGTFSSQKTGLRKSMTRPVGLAEST